MTRTEPSRPRILITDDEKDIRLLLRTLLDVAGFDSIEASNGVTALKILEASPLDAVILDMNMPDMSGMSVFQEAGKLGPIPPVVMLTGYGSIHAAVEAMKEGVFDYLTKPFDNEELIDVLRRAVEWKGKTQPPSKDDSLAALMGPSDKIANLSSMLRLVAPTNFTVVITGETGAGKELVAKEIHRSGRRASGPFIPVDCGSIAPTLIESELFGHAKGAFTGADRARAGKFEEAAGGTLFLDEVQNLTLEVQTKLLRALQERQVCRVGDAHPIELDVRIVAASNEDLSELVENGRFRRDLHHRLNEFAITIPPLRTRPTDLIYLANSFITQTVKELEKPHCVLSDSAVTALLAHHWPGNVRELRNVTRRAVLLAGSVIEPEHLQIDSKDKSRCSFLPPITDQEFEPISLKEVVRQGVIQKEREILTRTLEYTHGNHARAARLLQIDYKTLRLKTKQYDIHHKNTGV